MAGKNNDTNMPMVHCSFCGKTEKQVHKLIAGPNGVYICDECIDLCDEILAEEFKMILIRRKRKQKSIF